MTIPPPKNLLVSFAYYHNWDCDRLAPCRIIADSGAYSARKLGFKVTNRKLAGWIALWDHRFQWAASLDVAGDIPLSRKNWLTLVNDYGIPAVPTLHVGDDPSEMDWYIEQAGVDFFGLGGMAGSATSPMVQFRWLTSIFKYIRDNHPEVRTHGWGITRTDWLRLPFFSCDSSGWGSSYRYGRIKLRHPLKPGKSYALDLDGRSKKTFSPEVAELLIDHYGVRPSEIAKSGPANRMLLVKLSALSASVQEQQWRQQHRKSNITVPKWGHLGGWELPPGPNQHLAMGGCGAGLREIKVMEELHGPHLHLVDGHPRHIEAVAELARERQ